MAPIDLVGRLKAYVTGEKDPKVPVMKTSVAVGLLVAYTLVYVIPFYISAATRPSATLSRDAPSVIRGRIRLVTTSCVLCSISTFLILQSYHNNNTLYTLHSLGYYPIGAIDTVKTVGLTAVLFLGPLFESTIVEGRWRSWIKLEGVQTTLSSWMGWRNLVAGPITEEVLFRSTSVPLLLLSQMSNTQIVFITPVIFGLAHVHHFYEFRITHPHTPLPVSIARTVVQFTYTSLFGGYVTFLYMRTGSLLAVIMVHAFCNFMGLPRFWGRVSAGESNEELDLGGGKKSEDVPQGDGELHIIWTVVYYIILVVGAVSWYGFLLPWTESAMGLVHFK